MPKRDDIQNILLIGSGPIVIGQACEFDYSGTQAVRALKESNYRVILVNSNPATIMTDPIFADRVYIEPLEPDTLERIIAIEKPDAILATMGGQTALNLTMDLHRRGVLQRYGVEVLGASPDSIEKAEDRALFRKTVEAIGIESAKSFVVTSLDEGKKALKALGLPIILRPSFTLGGEGGGICYHETEFIQKLERGLALSPVKNVLLEESLLGWKEFELEVVRDRKDNVIIVCSIENFDPMGVHTGDSITVAPAQTLTDREFQNLRNQSLAIIRAIGVETGGSNIQFAVHPKTGRVVCIEMNPRVSRSSALASKATGFPIARVATKLAIGFTLDELKNDITLTTPCSFEPALDYVVVKIPRFDFDKFRPTPPHLTTQMKSVGEVMAIGRTFSEAFQKALLGLEIKQPWLAPLNDPPLFNEELLRIPQPKRIRAIADALRCGVDVKTIHEASNIDPWFLNAFADIILQEKEFAHKQWPLERACLLKLKKSGWSDLAIANVLKIPEKKVRDLRTELNIRPVYNSVDTCAAEFEAITPYHYSTYNGENEVNPTDRKKIIVLGGGPNRIGQGIEFDYCCVHASYALRELGYEAIMLNSNPETVSTDFDVSDRLYFEPVTAEHVLDVIHLEKPDGVIVQFGGQTPLRVANVLAQEGVTIFGTQASSIDIAEDREKCSALIKKLSHLGIMQPEAKSATNKAQALKAVQSLGFPVLARPSYVLGGRGMKILRNDTDFQNYIEEAIELSENSPLLIDRFLDRALEVDVDALGDGEEIAVVGIMEHIEEAGIHSGDSTCCIPPVTLPSAICQRITTYTKEIGKALSIRGLMNIQFAVQGDQIYVLEINPRASRTIPYVSKAIGLPLAKIATGLLFGKKIAELPELRDIENHLVESKIYNVKMPVFPFSKFPETDVLLGPEMKSTGEVMGRGESFGLAYAKALLGAGFKLPHSGQVFFSVRDEDKAEALSIALGLYRAGFKLVATTGTALFLKQHNLPVSNINKVAQGSPHCVDKIKNGDFNLVINTTSDAQAVTDSFSIRRAALEMKIPYCTVLTSARALLEAVTEIQKNPMRTKELYPL